MSLINILDMNPKVKKLSKKELEKLKKAKEKKVKDNELIKK